MCAKAAKSPISTTSAIASSGKRLTVEAIAAAVNKVIGDESIRPLGGGGSANVSALSTGCLAIDLATGINGLPRGRIIELFGPESSGKTTLCSAVIAAAQRRGEFCAMVDVEHAFDPAYARVCGVDTDSLLFSQPDSGEQALQTVEALVRTEEIGVIVLDSVAALTTKAELDGQMGDATVGAQARLMSQAMRRLTAIVSKTNCICIFTNQIREKIGVMFGNPEVTPGGRALKFFASMRIDIRRRDQIKEPDGKVVGNMTKIKFVKNKVAAPYTECEFEILFDEGVSRSGSLLDLAVTHKVVEKKGAWFAYNGNLIGQGRDAARRFLRENSQAAAEIQAKILAIVRPHASEAAAAGVAPDPDLLAKVKGAVEPISSPLASASGELVLPDQAESPDPTAAPADASVLG